MKLLIIDDEVKLADAIGELFRQQKYVVDVVYDGEDGLYCAKTGDYDVILLDVMMPKIDGFEVIKRLREGIRRLQGIVLFGRNHFTPHPLHKDSRTLVLALF